MSTEQISLSKVEKYFKDKGWKVSREVKLRGRVADLVALKDGEIALVEVKGASGDMHLGIEQALHQKNTANFSYLAIPKEQASNKIVETCRNLGVGLILVNHGVKETVKPAHARALQSVERILLGKPKKQEQVITSVTSLEMLFRSKALIQILKLLFLNSTLEFHMNDIARKVGLSPSTIAKETKILSELGLIEKRMQGNLVFYKINKKSLIYDELKRIFMKYELLDQILAAELPREQIKYALIYGSIAKGTEEAKSDVDLLVVGKVSEDALLNSVSKAQSKIGREINYILWSEKEFQEKSKQRVPLLKNISKTPIIMIIGDESEFKRSIKQRAR
ncbi:MAG: nucleotidyltransferase domain-containing protein [Nitrososphaerales archaeon]